MKNVRTQNKQVKEWARFSVEWSQFGGITKKDAITLLRKHGIAVRTSGAYSPFLGQYGLLIDKAREDEASKLLFG